MMKSLKSSLNKQAKKFLTKYFNLMLQNHFERMIRHSRCKSSKIQNYTHKYKSLMFMSGCTSYWGNAVISIISPSEVQCWPSAGLHYSHMLHWSSNTGQTFILYTNTNIQHLVLICTYSHLELSFFSKLMQRIIKLPFNTLFLSKILLCKEPIFLVCTSPPFWVIR